MPPHLHPSVQELINSGAVAHVVGDSPISVGQIVAVDHVALAFAPETLRDVRPSSVKALGESRLADSGAARRLASTTVHRLWGLALAD